MIHGDDFINAAADRSFTFFTGVPCSFLTPFINTVIENERLTYVGATNEGEAVAIASGAWLAGARSVVMCQNSGLGNCVNPLTSLNYPFEIPILLVTTWRGQPGIPDEPQHALMGDAMHGFLDLMRVSHRAFPSSLEAVAETLDDAVLRMEKTSRPHCLVMRKGDVETSVLAASGPSWRARGKIVDLRERASRPTRVSILEAVVGAVSDDAAIIATTGKTGRELFTISDRPQHLYQVGSMGCSSALGLGVAMNCKRSVIVLDGDGAALMKLGALATIGETEPENLVHIILDNGTHDSTGGQATASENVDFSDVAIACGYKWAFSSDSLSGFSRAFSESLASKGPTLIHVRIRPGSMARLGRPTVPPAKVARRFRDFLMDAA